MAAGPPVPTPTDGLTLAVVDSSAAPLLLLDGAFTVIAASRSFCRGFGLDPAMVGGRRLDGLGDGEWAGAQLGSLLSATAAGHASIDAYEMDLDRPGLARDASC